MHTDDPAISGPQVVFALYRPHAGKDADLRQILAGHVPTLRRRGLITDRAAVVVRAADGTYIEVFEWATPESAGLAHQDPEVAMVWEAIGQVADLPTLANLAEAGRLFPHFAPVAL